MAGRTRRTRSTASAAPAASPTISVAVHLEEGGDSAPEDGVVVDHHNGRHRLTGSRTETRVPRPGPERKETLPPISEARSVIERMPDPCPPRLGEADAVVDDLDAERVGLGDDAHLAARGRRMATHVDHRLLDDAQGTGFDGGGEVEPVGRRDDAHLQEGRWWWRSSPRSRRPGRDHPGSADGGCRRCHAPGARRPAIAQPGLLPRRPLAGRRHARAARRRQHSGRVPQASEPGHRAGPCATVDARPPSRSPHALGPRRVH